MRALVRAALIASIVSGALHPAGAQTPTLVRDLNPIGADAITGFGSAFRRVGATICFFARDANGAWQVFRTNGTAAGTVPLTTFTPTQTSRGVSAAAVAAGRLFFAVEVAPLRNELWITDGTQAGTRYVVDLPGRPIDTYRFTPLGGRVLFGGVSTAYGYELWITDGTAAGTTVLDMNPGTGGSSPDLPPTGFEPMDGVVYYGASDAAGGWELWRTDGTVAGTRMVADLTPGPAGSSVGSFTNVAGTVFFRARTPGRGSELWKSDGTAAGTVLVADVAPGSPSSVPDSLLAVGGQLYFWVSVGNDQRQLWRSGGDAASTVLVSPQIYQRFPVTMHALGATLYFAAAPFGGEMTLWRTDGTPAGTTPVPGVPIPAEVTQLSSIGSRLYFDAIDAAGSEVWTVDGANGVATRWLDVVPGPEGSRPTDFIDVGGQTWFVASDRSAGREPWKTDGTPAGTTRIADVNPGTIDGAPRDLVDLDGTLIFVATDADAGIEPWRSDGTSGGTTLIADLLPGGHSAPNGSVRAGDRVFFVADDAAGDAQLWKTDGSAIGTLPVGEPAFAIGPLWSLANQLFFRRSSDLWRTDGSAAGTALVAHVDGPVFCSGGFCGLSASQPVPVMTADTLFIQAVDSRQGGLYRSSGTPADLVRLADAGSDFFDSHQPVALDDVVFFTGAGVYAADTLWRTDGTPAGTFQLASFDRDGDYGVDHRTWVRAGNQAYFRARKAETGYELWRSDGTAEGTLLVADLNPGPAGSQPRALTAAGSYVYFSADTPGRGRELWRTDGTEAGTVLVGDLEPGPVGSDPGQMAAIEGNVFFAATTMAAGREPWRTVVTTGATAPLGDVFPGPESSSPDEFTQSGGRVFFVATEPIHGRELWSFAAGPCLDGDGDGVCDLDDACTDVPGDSVVKLTLVGAGGLAGSDTLKVQARFPAPPSFAIDPVSTGVRALVTGASGALVADVTVPPGAFDPAAGGWTTSRDGFTYRSARGTPSEVRTVRIRARGGEVNVRLQVKRTTLASPDGLPLSVTVVLYPPTAPAGRCTEHAFGAGTCRQSGARILCR